MLSSGLIIICVVVKWEWLGLRIRNKGFFFRFIDAVFVESSTNFSWMALLSFGLGMEGGGDRYH